MITDEGCRAALERYFSGQRQFASRDTDYALTWAAEMLGVAVPKDFNDNPHETRT